MPQCKGFTKDGNRCQKEVKLDYCWQHETAQNPQVGGLRQRLRKRYRDLDADLSKTEQDFSDDPIIKTLSCTCDCQGNIDQEELMQVMQASGLLNQSRGFEKITINPNISFDGKCEEAFKFYEKVFGGKITTMMRYNELPKNGPEPTQNAVPTDYLNKIAHASMIIGNTELMGSDAPPDQYVEPAGFSVSVNLDSPKKAERIFKALSSGGKITMPLKRTSWADRFGMVTDKYGIPWMINSTAQSS